MRSIGEFFGRIQNKQAQELFLRQTIQDIIRKVAKIDIPFEKITFKGRNLALKGLNSTEKSELFLKKQRLIKAISEQPIKRVVTDIKFS